MLDIEFKTALDSLQDGYKTGITGVKSLFDKQQSKIDELQGALTAVQRQADSIDAAGQHRHVAGGSEVKTLGELFVESGSYLSRKTEGFGGRQGVSTALACSAFPMSIKTNITDATLGSATTGVLVPQRLPGVTGIPQQALRVRDLLTVRPQTTGSSFDWIRQIARTNAASPQVEADPKAESTYLWDTSSGAIQTIAHYTNISRQALDDVPWLRAAIDGEMTYGLKVKEENEILSGDGTGVHLLGIIPQAADFDTALLHASAGWTPLDILRYAKLQCRRAGKATFAPSAYVLNPDDICELDLIKDGFGRYVISTPAGLVTIKTLWGLPVVESDSISAGTFLVGAFDTAVDFVDRQQIIIDISFEHYQNFTTNLATLLCEERVGMAVRRPDAFVVGAFTSSP